jgi:hypothetical protein
MKILLFVFLLLSTQIAFAQNPTDKIQLNFDLRGQPKLEDVGFDAPKSKWKVTYFLRLVDKETTRKNTRSLEDIQKKKKKKKNNKLGVNLYKGNFVKTNLSSEANRSYSITIPINEKGQSEMKSKKQLDFSIRVKGFVFSDKVGKRRKFDTTFLMPLDYYINKVLSVDFELRKEEDGTFWLTI